MKLLGYCAEISFAPMTNEDLNNLYTEFNEFVRGSDTMENEAVKAEITKEVKSLNKKIDSFFIPSGHKNIIRMIRDRYQSKIYQALTTNQMKPQVKPSIDMKQKLCKLINSYIQNLPVDCESEETFKAVNITQSTSDDRMWKVSCPFCIKVIRIQNENGKFNASNYRRHVSNHTKRSSPNSSEDLLMSSQNSITSETENFTTNSPSATSSPEKLRDNQPPSPKRFAYFQEDIAEISNENQPGTSKKMLNKKSLVIERFNVQTCTRKSAVSFF